MLKEKKNYQHAVHQGIEQLRMRRLDDAIKSFRTAITSCTTASRILPGKNRNHAGSSQMEAIARYHLAHAYIDKAEYSKAQHVIEIALDRCIPQLRKATGVVMEIRLRSLLATAMALLGKFDCAKDEISGCLDLLGVCKGSSHAKREVTTGIGEALGVLAREIGEPEKAKEAFQLALELSPRNTGLLRHLSNLALVNNDHERALRYLTHAIRYAPEEVLTHLMKGEVFLTMSANRKAYFSYKRALSISPKGHDADYTWYMMAESLYRMGRAREAAKLWRFLKHRFPDSPLRHDASKLARNIERASDGRRVVISEFPTVLQKRAYCGPAVLFALLQYYGRQATQEAIGREIADEGVPLHRLSKCARDMGLHVVTLSADLRILKTLIDINVPVVVDEFRGLEGHYLIVIGYDEKKETLIVRDPNYFASAEILYSEFKKSWRYNGNWAMVALPEEAAQRLPTFSAARVEKARIAENVERLTGEGKLTSAYRMCTAGLKKFSHHKPLLRMEVEILLRQHRWDEAEKSARRLAERLDTFWAHKLHGDANLGMGRVRQALRSYLKARRLCPGEQTVETLLNECKQLLRSHV